MSLVNACLIRETERAGQLEGWLIPPLRAHGSPKYLQRNIMSALRDYTDISFELVRRAVRNTIGYRSPTYQLGSNLLTSLEVMRREGYSTWKRLRALSMGRSS